MTMSDASNYPKIGINQTVLNRAQLPFMISILSSMGLLILIFSPMLLELLTGRPLKEVYNLPVIGLLALYFPHLLLFITTIVSGFVGYKLVVAAGASKNPIPPNDHALLAPLIQAANSEAIDQYVRLSSLRGFTGTFTKLGLTGLPLTTVALTLIFAMLALLSVDTESQKSFFDLTKLTLGAFIGSFVQRSVEQRRTPG